MSSVTADLWPADLKFEEVVPPVSILKAQANFIGQRTQNLIEGNITTSNSGNSFGHSFTLVAPALGGYRYHLFSIEHDVKMYPVTLFYRDDTGNGLICRTEAALSDAIRDILSSDETRKIVSALVAQSKAL